MEHDIEEVYARFRRAVLAGETFEAFKAAMPADQPPGVLVLFEDDSDVYRFGFLSREGLVVFLHELLIGQGEGCA